MIIEISSTFANKIYYKKTQLNFLDMKKLSTLLMLLLIAQLSIAQGKFDKRLSSSDADIANPKKSGQAKTWVNRGNLFVEIAESPVEGLMTGMDKMMIGLQLKGEKPTETKEWKSPTEEVFEVQVFPDKDLYFNQAGQLSFWTVKKAEVENPLAKALEAYNQAQKIDPNNKDVKSGYQNLSKAFSAVATDGYMRNDYKLALDGFKGLYQANTATGMLDTATMYNIAFIANVSGDYPLAEEYYQKCIDNGYISEGGIYASLADVMNKNGKKDQAAKLLSDAYTKYPTNQSILISLINFYMETGDDPKKVISIIKTAQANEPTNASLDYAEGSLYEKLKENDKAEAAYKSAISKDAKNFYAQYSLGALYYNEAVELSKLADELPINEQKKYDEYIVKINELLKKSMDPFEAAYSIEQNPVIVESLKNVYYRFVDESPDMKAKYEKYDAMLKTMN